MMLSTSTLQSIDEDHYLPVFERYPLTIVRAEGSRLWDDQGRSYIDLLAGIAVNSVGHCHPKVVAAVQQQVARVMHVSNLCLTEPQARLTQQLTERSGLERAFFSNSGAEAVEAAFKVARKYAHHHGRGGTIISMEGGFHGRTLATAAAGKSQYQQGFDPIPEGFVRVPFNDIDAVKNAVTNQTAAIIVEPVQWEEGIRVAHQEFLAALRLLCDEQNIVLIFDEIQCGMARTGKLFAYQKFGVKPDIITLAKALGGGMPMGATLVKESVANALNRGDHGTTFGGNPVACAAALAVLTVIEEENLAEQARITGARAMEYLGEQRNDVPSIISINGIGLILGVQLNRPARPFVEKLLDHGVLASAVGGDTIRLVPPLNISWEAMKEGIDILLEVLKISLDEQITRSS